jgi:hypothetical protein
MIRAPSPVHELIRFDLELCTQFWRTPPGVDIWIDQHKICSLTIDRDQHYQFDHLCVFGDHELRLVRHGKSDAETRQDINGHYETQTLSLTSLMIDGIDIKNIMLDRCHYYPDYPEPWASQQRSQGHELESVVKGEIIFGHNGIWRFRFRSPFYKFMVDCVRGHR